MTFSSLSDHDSSDRPCISDDVSEEWLSYRQFNGKIEDWKGRFPGQKSLVFLYLENSVDSVASFFGAVAAGHAVALLDPSLPPASRENLNELYLPDFIVSWHNDKGLVIEHRSQNGQIHPDLTILLSTSGSTGSPKFVRLTAANVVENAKAIAECLDIQRGDVACAHLPLHYSFGLSVLTSHLVAGAAVRLTSFSLADRNFWESMKKAGITHFPGVPFHFQMLERLRYERLDLPALKSMAQAGGFLEVASRTKAHDYMGNRNGKFYVMYGQTEAAPRMTTLGHDDFVQSPSSVGQALPGGCIRVVDEKAQAVDSGNEGAVEYSGPNVMMGYAERRADLLKGDELNGTLATGDIGTLDEAGRLTLVGRAKRSAKIYGLRVNLDEVESLLRKLANDIDIAVTQRLERLIIHYSPANQKPDSASEERMKALLAERYTLPRTCYKFYMTNDIPRTVRGKIDYQKLEQAK